MCDPVTTIAAASGASQGIGGIVGAEIQGQHQENIANIQNETHQTVPNPYYDAMMTRVMGIVDAYMQKHGITPTVGINPNAPQVAGGPPAPSAMPAPAPEPPTPTAPTTNAPKGPEEQSTIMSPRLEDGMFNDTSMAAQLGARRMGITKDVPSLPTTRDFYAQDQAQKQAELDRLYKYIYGQRSVLGGPMNG